MIPWLRATTTMSQHKVNGTALLAGTMACSVRCVHCSLSATPCVLTLCIVERVANVLTTSAVCTLQRWLVHLTGDRQCSSSGSTTVIFGSHDKVRIRVCAQSPESRAIARNGRGSCGDGTGCRTFWRQNAGAAGKGRYCTCCCGQKLQRQWQLVGPAAFVSSERN